MRDTRIRRGPAGRIPALFTLALPTLLSASALWLVSPARAATDTAAATNTAVAPHTTVATSTTVATVAAARPLRSIDGRSISRAAMQAVRALAGAGADTLLLTAAPLDARLRLPACDRALETFITDDGQVRPQTTVGVRCAGSVRWTFYTSITVESVAPVLTARYALPRDAALTAADFQVQTRHVPGLIAGYLSTPAALAGQRLRRPVSAGEPLSIDALAPAPLVRRGQQVVLVARGAGIEVRATGIALSDGRASDHIRVQNLSSQRIVEGIVRSDSVVETPL
jgi:flagella basal body P-ring formation protein FlgA